MKKCSILAINQAIATVAHGGFIKGKDRIVSAALLIGIMAKTNKKLFQQFYGL